MEHTLPPLPYAMDALADNLRRLRKQAKLTQAQLADRGVHIELDEEAREWLVTRGGRALCAVAVDALQGLFDHLDPGLLQANDALLRFAHAQQQNRRVLISANGLARYVDLQVLGIGVFLFVALLAMFSVSFWLSLAVALPSFAVGG